MKEVFDGKTYYDILEIPPNAGSNEIQKAYEKTKEAYSPSSPALYTIFTPDEAQQLNSLIDSAYSILSNPNRRAEYDKSLQKELKMKSNITEAIDQEIKSEAPVNTTNMVNMGKTSFGPYSLDTSFEEKIKNTELFDGEFLQKVRHYKNINLEQLSEKSKISKSYVLAIESHDFESLPAKVFVRGFVVQIAKLMNLDPIKVSSSYMKLFDAK
jgi:curved DNA-binding protein CbpA